MSQKHLYEMIYKSDNLCNVVTRKTASNFTCHPIFDAVSFIKVLKDSYIL